jgi:hypothetical protein
MTTAPIITGSRRWFSILPNHDWLAGKRCMNLYRLGKKRLHWPHRQGFIRGSGFINWQCFSRTGSFEFTIQFAGGADIL